MTCSCGIKSIDQCTSLFEATLVKEFSDFDYFRFHRLTVDAYSLQHPDKYLRSAKSFAAHLCGMCCYMEHDNDKRILKALQQWLSGAKQLEKPEMLTDFGNLTIESIIPAKSASEHIELVQQWADEVWNAYTPYHGLAHEWIQISTRSHFKKELTF